MKNMTSKLLTVFTIIYFLFLNQNLLAQKNSDLELRIISPEPESVIKYGDTTKLTYLIINHGPDDLTIEEEIYVTNDLFFIYQPQKENLAVGDSTSIVSLTAWNSREQTDTFNACYFLDFNAHIGIDDPNQTNDTACITFYLEGSTPSNIKNISSDVLSNFTIYPNPASTSLNISIDLKKASPLEIIITDVLGREVSKKHFGQIEPSKTHHFSIDISMFDAGVYFLKLNGDNFNSIKKLHVR